jgi:hypothetical protein
MTPGQPNTPRRATAPTPQYLARRCLGWLAVWLTSIVLGLGPAQADGQADVSDKVGLSFSGLGLNRYTNTFDTTATLTNLSGVTISAPLALAVTGISQASVTLANAAGLTADGHPYVNVPLATGRFEPGARVTGVVLKYNNPNRVKFLSTHAVHGVLPNANHPPAAHAGPDQTAFVGRTVTLDGGGSTDLDGDPLTYRWTLTGLPVGSAALLAGAGGINPSFTVDRPGSYTAQLTVNDGQADSAPDSVVVSTRNSPPAARAGADRTAPVGEALILDGSASGDADGDPLAFLWSLTQRPAGSAAALSQPDTQGPGLTLDKPGHYEARLVVNDGRLDSDPDLVAIDTRNSPPVAAAGPDQTGRAGDAFVLDGSASGDVDNDALTYRWSLLSQPAGSQAALANPAAAVGSLTPDLAGDYVAQLIVNDGQADSAPDTARITAQANRAPRIASTPPPRPRRASPTPTLSPPTTRTATRWASRSRCRPPGWSSIPCPA